MNIKNTLLLSGLALAGFVNTVYAVENAAPCVSYAEASWFLNGESPYQAFTKCRSGSIVSDPHITTFNGIAYDHNFPGDYALVALQDGTGFSINGRFIFDKANTVSAYTIPKAIQFNWLEHSLEIHRSEDSTLVFLDGAPLKVKNNGKVAIGDVGYIQRKDKSYLIANTQSDIATVVNVNKFYVDINVTVPSETDTVGLLGQPFSLGLLDGNGAALPVTDDSTDTGLGHVTRADFVEFIESWRLTNDNLFATEELPALPDYSAKIYRLADLSTKRMDKAQTKCEALEAELPERFDLNNCLFDMGFGGSKFSVSAHRNQPSSLRLNILE